MPSEPQGAANGGQGEERRSLLGWASRFAMAGGLLASYGTLAALMARFLYPARPPRRGWMYVTDLASLAVGSSLLYRTPDGATVNVARQGAGKEAGDYIALSSTCPHLGCHVHWEAHNNRFFCPCHNGAFDPSGTAVAGPPADAGQSLPAFPLKVENGLLFIEVPLEVLAMGNGEVVECPTQRGAGHDPCLYADRTVARSV